MRGVELNHARITFHLPMPKSWSQVKRENLNGTPHCSRPDLDNLFKALADSFGEDSHIYEVHMRKVWAERGAIEIQEGYEWSYDDLPF